MLEPYIIAITYILALEFTLRTLIATNEISRLKDGLFRAGAFFFSLVMLIPAGIVLTPFLLIIGLICQFVFGLDMEKLYNIN